MAPERLGLYPKMSGIVARVSKFNARPAPYADVLKLQDRLHALVKADGPTASTSTSTSLHHHVLVLQHAHTYTVGKRGREDLDFKHTRSELATLMKPAPSIVRVPRGGETTYHGPGQLVVYPIVDLRRLRLGPRAFVESLEDAMVDAAGEYGVEARGRVPGKTGVWVGDRKIGAIGVAISGGVSRHGLAFNVAPALEAFSHIVACGEEEAKVTSLERETGRGLDLVDVGARLTARVLERLYRHCEVRVEEVGDVWEVMREYGVGSVGAGGGGVGVGR